MSQPLPLVSIIVAVFNAGKTLQQCIDSVASQTYAHKQLIIIDGGSTDNTVEVIKKSSEKINFSISEKDRGIYDAWNKGLTQAQGEWVCFLGADDYLYNSQVIENMIFKIQDLPDEIQIAYGQVALVDDAGKEKELLGQDWSEIKQQIKQVMCIPHPAVFHRRTLFEQSGNFNGKFRIAGDYEMLLRALKNGDAYSVMGLIVVAMRVGGVSSKPGNAIESFKEMRLAQKIHGLNAINSVLFLRIFKEHLRKVLWSILGEKYAKKLLDFMRYLRGLEPYWEKIN
ncbi:MAG TPA: glycosyltransferase family 2 protein [Methylophilaceae bacterium]|nr:glycosyltransferase family 2 protein [Methylophilaceae bacterium]